MTRALARRVQRLEQHAIDSLPTQPWLVVMTGQSIPDALPSEYGGVVEIQIVDGRKPYRIYDGERLAPRAWPNLLLVPTAGPRPADDPLDPDLIEQISGYPPRLLALSPSHDDKSGDTTH